MSSVLRWIVIVVLALVLCIGLAGVTFAQPPKPIITTPTPTPRPLTPEELQARLQQQADQNGTGGLATPYFDVRTDTFSYIVQEGDTLWDLALDFGRDLDTMSCATSPSGPDAETLVPGSTIMVPALADLCYTVRPWETLAGIALRHGLAVEQIVAVNWNGFGYPPYYVLPRQRVLLPGVRREPPVRPPVDDLVARDTWAASPWPDWPYGEGVFQWPVSGPISQYAHDGHWALDIAIPTGTHILAADRGRVKMAGWNGSGYGFRVVIDHGNDYMTLYAHLSDIYVEPDQVVGKGQVIGASGANGNITGPHLHFEIRDFGSLVDPLRLLPR